MTETIAPVAEQSGSEGSVTEQVERVGWLFVQEYYTCLNKDPGSLHRFYLEDSVYAHGTEGGSADSYKGQKEIHQRILDIGFVDCQVLVSNLDAQPSTSNGILLQVLGELSNNAVQTQKFCQSFFLAKQQRGYYILNDMFRFLKEEVGAVYECVSDVLVNGAESLVDAVKVEIKVEVVQEKKEKQVEVVEAVANGTAHHAAAPVEQAEQKHAEQKQAKANGQAKRLSNSDKPPAARPASPHKQADFTTKQLYRERSRPTTPLATEPLSTPLQPRATEPLSTPLQPRATEPLLAPLQPRATEPLSTPLQPRATEPLSTPLQETPDLKQDQLQETPDLKQDPPKKTWATLATANADKPVTTTLHATSQHATHRPQNKPATRAFDSSRKTEHSAEEREKYSVFVGDIPPQTTSVELYDVFSDKGQITCIEVVGGKGIAFIEFATVEGCKRAAGQSATLHGKKLVMEARTVRPKRDKRESDRGGEKKDAGPLKREGAKKKL